MKKWNDATKKLPPNNINVLCKLKSGQFIIANIIPMWHSNFNFDPNDQIMEWTEVLKGSELMQ